MGAVALKLKLTRKPQPAPQDEPLPLPLPNRARAPYRAAHTPGRPDNEWEVRDADGILVKQVIGSDFDVAKRRCDWLAGQLNKAFEAGRQCR